MHLQLLINVSSDELELIKWHFPSIKHILVKLKFGRSIFVWSISMQSVVVVVIGVVVVGAVIVVDAVDAVDAVDVVDAVDAVDAVVFSALMNPKEMKSRLKYKFFDILKQIQFCLNKL